MDDNLRYSKSKYNRITSIEFRIFKKVMNKLFQKSIIRCTYFIYYISNS